MMVRVTTHLLETSNMAKIDVLNPAAEFVENRLNREDHPAVGKQGTVFVPERDIWLSQGHVLE